MSFYSLCLVSIFTCFISISTFSNPVNYSSYDNRSYSNTGASTGHFKKVVLVVFENTGYQKTLKQKDFAQFARSGALLTNFTAETHPSQGNYIAMIAGNTFGIRHDNNVDLQQNHLGDLLENVGKDWKVYAEDFPGNCFLGASSQLYARKHNPFISFLNVSTNKNRCQKIVNASSFDQDLISGRLPEFTMYIPNLKNDGHNTGVDYAGNFLSSKFGIFLENNPALKDVLLVITFDEGQTMGSNQIFTLLIGNSVVPESQFNQPLNHAGILRMLEDEFSLGSLNQNDAISGSITGIWK